ncbi:hypothetical protein J3E72DRAFT_269552 [Bipolaris maydis]|nr:hypothetical protein J3E72DRAFT_269552 [Bipolaris maydis]
MRVQVLALLASSLAALGSARMPAFAPAKDRLENREWAYDAHEIDQLSDRYVLHMNGTFKQRYFIRILMEKFSGLRVILENWYYGYGVLYNTTTTDELRFFDY